MSRRSWWVAGGIMLAYLGLTARAWSGAAAAQGPDSVREYPRGWLDFAGELDAANGGVVTPVLYAGIQSPVVIAGVQVFAFATAVSLLALATVRRLRGHWTGWVLAVLVLAISLVPVFWTSHLALASASLMSTSAVLWLASVVWFCSARRGERRPLIATAGALAFLALVQPGAMLALLPAQFVLLARWGRYERSGRAALATVMSAIPFAVLAIVRVGQAADREGWPLLRLSGGLVEGDASFRDYALAWAWVSNAPALFHLRLLTWSDEAVLTQSFNGLPLPSSSPWTLLVACLAVGILLALLAGVRPRVTLAGIIGMVLALALPAAYVYAGWAVGGGTVGSAVLPFVALAAAAALILPATIAWRPERSEHARRAALADITARWASPPAAVEPTGS